MTDKVKERIRQLIAKLVAVCKRGAHCWVILCRKHHRTLHKMEQAGNLIVLSSVSLGIHEIEAWASGYVALVLLVVIAFADDEA